VPAYRRPDIPPAVYVGEDGEPIRYGDRWPGMPPEDSYSRTSHLERFAPLHSVALALIDWLEATYDVEVDRDASTDDLLHVGTDVTKAVCVTPRDPHAAPITFVFTPFPGVRLFAGVLFEAAYPSCGCDACDECAEQSAEEMEWTVEVIVGGGFSEHVDSWPAKTFAHRLQNETGMRAGQQSARDLPAGRAKAARAQLPPSGEWHPWPLRAAGAQHPPLPPLSAR
jgi:hypothetical protein